MPTKRNREPFNTKVDYLRENVPSGTVPDDWATTKKKHRKIHSSIVSLVGKGGTETAIGAGASSVQTFDCVDRWHDGIKTSDILQDSNGTVYNIRSRVNEEQRNQWAVMVVTVKDG